MTVVGIALSLVTLGILLYHLWEHRTEAERKRVLDGFQERMKLADEYNGLAGYLVAEAYSDAELIRLRCPGSLGSITEYFTPKEVQDKITQMKADRYNRLLEENGELRVSKDRLTKQVEVLSRPVTGQDQEAVAGGEGFRYHISMTTTTNKKRRKKK